MSRIETELSTRGAGVRAEAASAHASCRAPVLLFTGTAVFWLLLSTLFGLIASTKLHSHYFLVGSAELTFGRVRMAHTHTVIYGWSSLAAFAASVWLMSRLTRAELHYPRLLLLTAVLWNLGVVLAAVGILLGDGASVAWMEAPRYAIPFFAGAMAIFVMWIAAVFQQRQVRQVHVSLWYILGAAFWFPWIYLVAHYLLFWTTTAGGIQAIVTAWYGHNLLNLWLTPVSLGVIYYLIPAITGRPIHSYSLAVIGFWSLAFFAGWGGMQHLIGGPIPAWLGSVSTTANVLMLIPVLAATMNFTLTLRGRVSQKLRGNPALWFTLFGVIAYLLMSVQGAVLALKDVSERIRFTHIVVAQSHFHAYAFVTMISFSFIYHVLPRVTGREWASRFLVHIHFWSCAAGITLFIVVLNIGGWHQGAMLNNPDVPFSRIVDYLRPHLHVRTAAGGLLAIGHLAFAALVLLNLCGRGTERDPIDSEDERPD